jgi:hypothetical protein
MTIKTKIGLKASAQNEPFTTGEHIRLNSLWLNIGRFNNPTPPLIFRRIALTEL